MSSIFNEPNVSKAAHTMKRQISLTSTVLLVIIAAAGGFYVGGVTGQRSAAREIANASGPTSSRLPDGVTKYWVGRAADGTITVARDAVPVPSVGPSADLLDAVARYSVVREVEKRAAVRVTGFRKVEDGLARADFSDGYAMVRYRFEMLGEGGCIKDETPDECTKRLTNNPFGFSVLSYELHRGAQR